MSLSALAEFKNGNIKSIKASEIKNDVYNINDIVKFYCESCLEELHLVQAIKKIWYFAGTHKENCIISKDGQKHPYVKIKEHTRINLEDILNYEDTRIINRGNNPGPDRGPEDNPNGYHEQGTDIGIEQQIDIGEEHDLDQNDLPNANDELLNKFIEIDGEYITEEEREEMAKNNKIYKYVVQTIKSVGTLYSFFKKEGLEIEIAPGVKGKDIFVTEKLFKDARDGFNLSGIRLMELQRADYRKLKYKIPFLRGYVLLRDAYAQDPECSIFVFVKLRHDERNQVFHTKVKGDRNNLAETIDPHKNIVILGDIKKIENDHYFVYIADINSRSYKFLNIKKK